METDLSIANLILGASALVKFVMFILLSGSVASWTLIFSKRRQMLIAKREIMEFEDEFWSTEDLTRLFNRVAAHAEDATGMERIFESGFREFARLRKRGGLDTTDILDGAQRAMKVTVNRELEALENHLPTLATIGSISPYVGLFGTVWGIMNSFQSLGNVHQATLAMVAPGISEALVATAMGLFAAIPAVVAYNRFASDIDRIFGRYDIFAEEFLAILRRQAHD
ncbi:MAG: protein TolQ [Proteobacteria bacterium]|nr:protein TolQ [Pseudomonadota bacterium]MBK8958058.1 protein TolQ [Pseudomonadota bacterium]